MRSSRLRLVVVGVLGLSLAACARPAGSPAPSAPAPAAPAPAAPSPAVPSPAGSSPASGDGAADPVRACADDRLEATVTMQPVRDGAVRALVAVTNTGEQACRLNGRASIALTNAAAEVVPVPATAVDEPGPAVPITLKPGTSAFQGIKWTVCDKGSAACPAGNGLRFSVEDAADGPAAELSGFPAPEKSAITMKQLLVGTLQPVTQGVVAW